MFDVFLNKLDFSKEYWMYAASVVGRVPAQHKQQPHQEGWDEASLNEAYKLKERDVFKRYVESV